jgi:hypothetical protein
MRKQVTTPGAAGYMILASFEKMSDNKIIRSKLIIPYTKES